MFSFVKNKKKTKKRKSKKPIAASQCTESVQVLYWPHANRNQDSLIQVNSNLVYPVKKPGEDANKTEVGCIENCLLKKSE